MNSEVLLKLWKYKKQLETFLKRTEDDKVLIILQKICRLRVTIEMIQETTIGKLVNSLTSKKELGIGEKAVGLVEKWKKLIDEVVDKKYKSDDECDGQTSPPKKVHVEIQIKKSPQNPKKSEITEKPQLKRKSEVLEERQKPLKQSRTNNKSVILNEDFFEDNNKTSFLDALNHKTSKSAEIENKSTKIPKQNEDSDDEFLSTSGRNGEMNDSNYPDDVLEHLINISTMIEERKRNQPIKPVEQDNLGGRKYAERSLFHGKKDKEKAKYIPTFVERFQQLLYDNMDNLEYIGDVPYEILEPILRKLKPIQLERFEHFNPVVVQKSDEIWKMHVLLKYPDKKPDEYGSWREIFLDCRDAMKAKFEQCLQKFTTNVAKMKKEEHKTKFFDPCVARPGKRNSILNRGGGPANTSSLVPGIRGRAFPQKAPLMQKTLKMMKSVK